MLDVDPQGFDVMDRKLLEAVIHRFDGGPVGLDNIAASIGEERDTIEDVIEPYLIQQGYLQRTPRGRIATLAAYRHLGVAPPRTNRAVRIRGLKRHGLSLQTMAWIVGAWCWLRRCWRAVASCSPQVDVCSCSRHRWCARCSFRRGWPRCRGWTCGQHGHRPGGPGAGGRGRPGPQGRAGAAGV
jgi:hypothetical protein